MKYIKKPVEIEAIQWNGKNTKKVRDFCNSGDGWNCGQTNPDNLEIYTLEGTMYASVNDYIIKGVNGEFYPCKPDIFEKTYDKSSPLEEVKKEWEDNGFEIISCSKKRFEVYKNWIKKGSHTYAKVVIDDYLYIVGEFSNKYVQLLNKTFRALGRFDDKNTISK